MEPAQQPNPPSQPEPPTTPAEGVSEPETSSHGTQSDGLLRDVNGLVASVDQLHAELRHQAIVGLTLAFAFGALAGIVLLQGRRLTLLEDALAG